MSVQRETNISVLNIKFLKLRFCHIRQFINKIKDRENKQNKTKN